MTNTGALESHRERDELGLALDGEDDGVGAFGERSRGRLTGRVNELRGQDPERQVTADDGVVVEGLAELRGLPGASGPGVSFGADVERS